MNKAFIFIFYAWALSSIFRLQAMEPENHTSNDDTSSQDSCSFYSFSDSEEDPLEIVLENATYIHQTLNILYLRAQTLKYLQRERLAQQSHKLNSDSESLSDRTHETYLCMIKKSNEYYIAAQAAYAHAYEEVAKVLDILEIGSTSPAPEATDPAAQASSLFAEFSYEKLKPFLAQRSLGNDKSHKAFFAQKISPSKNLGAVLDRSLYGYSYQASLNEWYKFLYKKFLTYPGSVNTTLPQEIYPQEIYPIESLIARYQSIDCSEEKKQQYTNYLNKILECLYRAQLCKIKDLLVKKEPEVDLLPNSKCKQLALRRHNNIVTMLNGLKFINEILHEIDLVDNELLSPPLKAELKTIITLDQDFFSKGPLAMYFKKISLLPNLPYFFFLLSEKLIDEIYKRSLTELTTLFDPIAREPKCQSVQLPAPVETMHPEQTSIEKLLEDEKKAELVKRQKAQRSKAKKKRRNERKRQLIHQIALPTTSVATLPDQEETISTPLSPSDITKVLPEDCNPVAEVIQTLSELTLHDQPYINISTGQILFADEDNAVCILNCSPLKKYTVKIFLFNPLSQKYHEIIDHAPTCSLTEAQQEVDNHEATPVQNHLTNLVYSAHVRKKMRNRRDTWHTFSPIVETFGHWGEVVVKDLCNSSNAAINAHYKKRFSLNDDTSNYGFKIHVTIPGRITTRHYQETKAREEGPRGVFEFIIFKKQLTDPTALCVHRFYRAEK